MKEDVEYSTKSMTLHQSILAQQFSNSQDLEALLELITERTNLSEEEALALDQEDLEIVCSNIAAGVATSLKLHNLGKKFDQ